ELPFHDCDENGDIAAVLSDENNNNNNVTPSEAPDDIFDIFKNKGLHFIHINARSMFNKLSEIQYIAKKTKPAIISITETWLDESHTNNSILIEGYKIVRRDRLTHGGGVCMYINEKLKHNNREDLQNQTLEDLWIELLLPHTKPIIVGTCYRAPNNSNASACLESTLDQIPADSDSILLGDFNYCLLKKK
ncbi:unnamed protein product, partial [Meganyctiphanes norvegica]